MNPRDHTQSEGTLHRALQSPFLRLPLGVCVLALYLNAGYIVTLDILPHPSPVLAPGKVLFPQSGEPFTAIYALFTSGIFFSVEAYCYSAKRPATPWLWRAMVSGLLLGLILWFLVITVHNQTVEAQYSMETLSLPFDAAAFAWIVGNVLVLVCLYFLWSWQFGLSRTGTLNLAIAATPIALVVYVILYLFMLGSALSGMMF